MNPLRACRGTPQAAGLTWLAQTMNGVLGAPILRVEERGDILEVMGEEHLTTFQQECLKRDAQRVQRTQA